MPGYESSGRGGDVMTLEHPLPPPVPHGLLSQIKQFEAAGAGKSQLSLHPPTPTSALEPPPLSYRLPPLGKDDSYCHSSSILHPGPFMVPQTKPTILPVPYIAVPQGEAVVLGEDELEDSDEKEEYEQGQKGMDDVMEEEEEEASLPTCNNDARSQEPMPQGEEGEEEEEPCCEAPAPTIPRQGSSYSLDGQESTSEAGKGKKRRCPPEEIITRSSESALLVTTAVLQLLKRGPCRLGELEEAVESIQARAGLASPCTVDVGTVCNVLRGLGVVQMRPSLPAKKNGLDFSMSHSTSMSASGPSCLTSMVMALASVEFNPDIFAPQLNGTTGTSTSLDSRSSTMPPPPPPSVFTFGVPPSPSPLLLNQDDMESKLPTLTRSSSLSAILKAYESAPPLKRRRSAAGSRATNTPRVSALNLTHYDGQTQQINALVEQGHTPVSAAYSWIWQLAQSLPRTITPATAQSVPIKLSQDKERMMVVELDRDQDQALADVNVLVPQVHNLRSSVRRLAEEESALLHQLLERCGIDQDLHELGERDSLDGSEDEAHEEEDEEEDEEEIIMDDEDEEQEEEEEEEVSEDEDEDEEDTYPTPEIKDPVALLTSYDPARLVRKAIQRCRRHKRLRHSQSNDEVFRIMSALSIPPLEADAKTWTIAPKKPDSGIPPTPRSSSSKRPLAQRGRQFDMEPIITTPVDWATEICSQFRPMGDGFCLTRSDSTSSITSNSGLPPTLSSSTSGVMGSSAIKRMSSLNSSFASMISEIRAPSYRELTEEEMEGTVGMEIGEADGGDEDDEDDEDLSDEAVLERHERKLNEIFERYSLARRQRTPSKESKAAATSKGTTKNRSKNKKGESSASAAPTTSSLAATILSLPAPTVTTTIAPATITTTTTEEPPSLIEASVVGSNASISSVSSSESEALYVDNKPTPGKV